MVAKIPDLSRITARRYRFICEFTREDGKPSGLKPNTGVRDDTDPDRCGVPEIVFDDGFGYEAA